MRKLVLAFSVAMAAGAAIAAPLTFPDRGRAAVVDAAHVMPPAAAAALNSRVAAWDNATGHQLAVVTLPSLQGHEIADYGYQLGRAWGLGRKGIDDGVVLILAPTEHKVRIEVGRGLEGDLTDADTAEILLNTVVPRLKAHDMPGALADGADAIMAAIPAGAGDTANAPAPDAPIWPLLVGALALIGGAAATILVVFDRRRRKSLKEFEERRRKVEEEMESGARKRSAAPVLPQNELRPPIPVAAPPVTRRRDPSAPLLHTGGYAPRGSGGPGTPPNAASGASKPAAASPIIAPVIIENSTNYESPRRRDDDSSLSSSWSSSSDSSSSSSSWDSGSSSSGFDSGGGSFSGGGSDSSW